MFYGLINLAWFDLITVGFTLTALIVVQVINALWQISRDDTKNESKSIHSDADVVDKSVISDESKTKVTKSLKINDFKSVAYETTATLNGNNATTTATATTTESAAPASSLASMPSALTNGKLQKQQSEQSENGASSTSFATYVSSVTIPLSYASSSSSSFASSSASPALASASATSSSSLPSSSSSSSTYPTTFRHSIGGLLNGNTGITLPHFALSCFPDQLSDEYHEDEDTISLENLMPCDHTEIFSSRKISYIIDELLQTEGNYVNNLKRGLQNYGDLQKYDSLPENLRGQDKQRQLLGNIAEILDLHEKQILPLMMGNQRDLKTMFDEMSAFIEDYIMESSSSAKKRALGSEEKLKLIEVVRQKNCIWDLTNALHSNHIAIAAAWREVAAEMGQSVDICKSAWGSLRDGRRYRLKAAAKKSGDAGGNILSQPTLEESNDWEFAEALNFLPSLHKKRKTMTNVNLSFSGDVTPVSEFSGSSCSNYTYKHHFDCYVTFTMNKKTSMQLRKDNREWFQSYQTEINDRLGIDSFLVQPIQRLTRYPLLLQQFISEFYKSGINCKPVLVSVCKLETRMRRLLEVVNQSEEVLSIDELPAELSIQNFGPFRRSTEFEAHNLRQRKKYKAKVFLFDQYLICVEVRKRRLAYRSHYTWDAIELKLNTPKSVSLLLKATHSAGAGSTTTGSFKSNGGKSSRENSIREEYEFTSCESSAVAQWLRSVSKIIENVRIEESQKGKITLPMDLVLGAVFAIWFIWHFL